MFFCYDITPLKGNHLCGSFTGHPLDTFDATLNPHSGLKQAALMEIVNGHAMNSPLLQLCAKMMMSGDHPPLFKLELMEKDARLATELHTQVGSHNPIQSITSATLLVHYKKMFLQQCAVLCHN